MRRAVGLEQGEFDAEHLPVSHGTGGDEDASRRQLRADVAPAVVVSIVGLHSSLSAACCRSAIQRTTSASFITSNFFAATARRTVFSSHPATAATARKPNPNRRGLPRRCIGSSRTNRISRRTRGTAGLWHRVPSGRNLFVSAKPPDTRTPPGPERAGARFLWEKTCRVGCGTVSDWLGKPAPRPGKCRSTG